MRFSFLVGLLAFFTSSTLGVSASASLLEEKGSWSYNARNWENPKTFTVQWKNSGGPDGLPWVRVHAQSPGWDTTLNRTLIFSRPVKTVHLSGLVRGENIVEGAEKFMAGRIQISFVDASGTQVGGWPASDLLAGTFEWKRINQTHRVPDGAVGVSLMLGLANAAGTIDYADIALDVTDDAGSAVAVAPPPTEVHTKTDGWWPLVLPAEKQANAKALDISQVLPSEPAGSRGRVIAKADQLVFETDDSPVVFWGTNVAAPHAWPSKKQAPVVADRLARSGINLVRFHQLDRGWNPDNIFDASTKGTRAFDTDKLDRFEFFVAELRKRGIYFFVDLLVDRQFKPADAVRDAEKLGFGAKMAAHFNPRLIELQKEYARGYLTHRNPYTGFTLAEDPAVVFISIINESNLFLDGSLSSYARLPASYQEELLGLFRDWCGRRNEAVPAGNCTSLLDGKQPQFWRFLQETQDGYFNEMTRFLREDLGAKPLISGSNFQFRVADAESNAALDFVDMHGYWDHPSGGWAETDRFANRPLSRELAEQTPFRMIAALQTAGKPFAISEWQAGWPNDTFADMPVLMGVIAGLQGWDAPMWFGYSGGEYEPMMSGVFGSDNKPSARLAAVVGSLIFRRGDFDALPLKVRALPRYPWANLERDLPPSDLFHYRNAWGRAAQAPASAPSAPAQVEWREPGFVRLNAPRTQGVVGAVPDAIYEGDTVKITAATELSTVVVTSLTQLPLASTERMLVLVLGHTENTDQTFRTFRQGLVKRGREPILVEPVHATLELRRPKASGLKLVPLDVYGRESGPARAPDRSEGPDHAVFNLGNDHALWFELSATKSDQDAHDSSK
jgi:hypothetical protein